MTDALTDIVDKARAYLDDAPRGGRHSDACELIEELALSVASARALIEQLAINAAAARSASPRVTAASGKLVSAMVGSCTCETKSSNRAHHAVMCRSRLISEALALLNPPQTSVGEERIAQQADAIAAWLLENAPYCTADQRHLDENTVERAYWHYGRLGALRDVLALLNPPSAA